MPTPVIPLYIREQFWKGAGFNFTGTDLHASGNLRARILNSSLPSYNIDSLEDMADLTPGTYEVATSSGSPAYTNGAGNGYIVLTPVVAQDDTNDRVELDFADITIGQHASGFTTAQHLALCKYAVSDANAHIVGMVDAGSAKSIQTGDLTWQLDAEGFCYW